ncbi:MAG TPA: hypothetical protein VK145_01435 [Candidatus Nanoarchaeia archaeon]|nr:hypothetical protein [Candidatus Nanoarchaeia archaeon]
MEAEFKAYVKNQNKKAFSTPGVWVERPRRSAVLICASCNGKYIKTRAAQKMCVRCMMRPQN